MPHSVSAAARLRAKSQFTLPEAVVQASGAEVGDRFVVEVITDDPDTIVLRRVRASYAGALAGMFDDTEAYLDGERASWTRRGEA